MKFDLPVEQGVFLKRYKRFFADILYDGEEITAHVPNTGSMKGLVEPDAPCRFTVSDDPKKKAQIHPADGEKLRHLGWASIRDCPTSWFLKLGKREWWIIGKTMTVDNSK